MITLEQVERLREKASVGYEDAKAALEATGDDLLEALIWLEKNGKTAPPISGGFYSSKKTESESHERNNVEAYKQDREDGFKVFMSKLGRLLAKIFQIGNTNYLVAHKRSDELFTCPVTVLVLFLIFFFWVVVPLLIISLFFGFKYSFRGSEFGSESVNKAMESVTDTAEDLMKKFQ